MPKQYIGFAEALRKTLASIRPGMPVEKSVSDCEGYVTVGKVFARVDSPSADTSLKDGYALRAEDSKKASGTGAQPLPVTGSAAAGQQDIKVLKPGTAFRILTGARLPEGADTVVAEELVTRSGDYLTSTQSTEKGQNILFGGSDITTGELLLDAGRCLTPGRIGLLTAGGRHRVSVYRKPAVALVATGDEVLLPGERPSAGKLYASNLLTLNGWCRHFGFSTSTAVVGDSADLLRERIHQLIKKNDFLITSGGAWTGDRDLMAMVLDDLGWTKVYHRVRLRPGKAVGFGMLDGKPVFILPGGPPSNLAAFLLLALPGLHRFCGYSVSGLVQMPAILKKPVSGQREWTQVIWGTLERSRDTILFQPHGRPMSRLKSMAEAGALLLIPEGTAAFSENQTVTVRILNGFST